jgi:hypothetical protein
VPRLGDLLDVMLLPMIWKLLTDFQALLFE